MLPVSYTHLITTEACIEYFKQGKQFPEGLEEELWEKLNSVETQVGKKFGDLNDPLLVSVRSGAPISMPGMMDTILNLGLNDPVSYTHLDVYKRQLYGLKAIRADKKIDIIVHLEPWLPPYDYDRLGDHYEYKEILGIKIPYIRIPVRPGRTIASIIEVAALNFRQNKLGINIVELLDERLKNINY